MDQWHPTCRNQTFLESSRKKCYCPNTCVTATKTKNLESTSHTYKSCIFYLHLCLFQDRPPQCASVTIKDSNAELNVHEKNVRKNVFQISTLPFQTIHLSNWCSVQDNTDKRIDYREWPVFANCVHLSAKGVLTFFLGLLLEKWLWFVAALH